MGLLNIDPIFTLRHSSGLWVVETDGHYFLSGYPDKTVSVDIPTQAQIEYIAKSLGIDSGSIEIVAWRATNDIYAAI